MRKVASADNRSIFYRACVKFVTWFVSKINRQVCRQMAWVSWEEKKSDNFDLLRKTHVGLTQCSKPVKNRKKPVFLIYSSRFLDGFERLSAEATFRTPAHTAKMLPLLAGYLWAWLFTIFPKFRACLQAICNHSERNNKQQQVLPQLFVWKPIKQVYSRRAHVLPFNNFVSQSCDSDLSILSLDSQGMVILTQVQITDLGKGKIL